MATMLGKFFNIFFYNHAPHAYIDVLRKKISMKDSIELQALLILFIIILRTYHLRKMNQNKDLKFCQVVCQL